MREQRIVLEHEADVPTVRRNIVDRRAVHQDTALGLAREARDQAQDRRLAATARPEKRDDLAGLDLEIDAVEDAKGAVGMAKTFDHEAHAVRGLLRTLQGRADGPASVASDTLPS